MIPGATTPYFQHNHQNFQMFDGIDELMPPSAGGSVDGQAQNLLYNLSVLKDRIQQLQTLVGLAVAHDLARPEPAAAAVSGAGTVIQEIIVAASSMMYAFQQAELGSLGPSRRAIREEEMSHHNNHIKSSYDGSSQATSEVIDHHVLHNLDASGARKSMYTNIHEANYNSNNSMSPTMKASHQRVNGGGGNNNNSNSNNKKGNGSDHQNKQAGSPACVDIIELDAADLLAKYTHYCQVCGKGFKRDANLRMHMRAHGDEYKTNAALTNPMKGGSCGGGGAAADCTAAGAAARKYSCPQEGCRWNRKHAKFQPLKSIICVKNHYKRSHCPKMYVCNRCNRKQFSVLSDLRTHEKHCGDTKWLCSCGTTFSRKDKLMGHVALFVGHAPMVGCFGKQQEKGEEKGVMERT